MAVGSSLDATLGPAATLDLAATLGPAATLSAGDQSGAVPGIPEVPVSVPPGDPGGSLPSTPAPAFAGAGSSAPAMLAVLFARYPSLEPGLIAPTGPPPALIAGAVLELPVSPD